MAMLSGLLSWFSINLLSQPTMSVCVCVCRVLDLVELWLGSEPALDLMVDTLLRLISLLEFSIIDRHQAPLETRLRSAPPPPPSLAITVQSRPVQVHSSLIEVD